MKEYIYKLKIKYRVKEVPIKSYTLFGAFCSAYYTLYGKLDFLESYKKNSNDIPFIISSLYPYYKDILFFPMPLYPIKKSLNQEELRKLKKIKKISFVSLNILKKLLKKELAVDDFFSIEIDNYLKSETNNKDKNKYTFISNSFLCENKKIDENTIILYKTDWIIRNKQARNQYEENERFEQKFYFFNPEGGLFFLVRFFNESFIEKFNKIINLLSDIGIGGLTSIGSGAFSIVDYKEFNEWNDIKESSGFISLSPFYPSDEDIKNISNSESYYKIESVRLKSTNFDNEQLWKPKISFFKEGSNFSYNINNLFTGKNIIIANKIVQYGLSYNIKRK